MNKKVIITIIGVVFVMLTASAVTYYIKNKSKVPSVSENINIPYFIDTTMKHERKINDYSLDTTSKEYRMGKLGFTANGSNVEICFRIL